MTATRRLLLQAGIDRLLVGYAPHVACERLNVGLRENRVRLWCDGNLLNPTYIRTELAATIEQEADGRWTCRVEPARGIGWERAGYAWEVDAAGIEALLSAKTNGAPPVDVSNAPASTLEEDPEDHPDAPTLRQEMILAILLPKFPNGIPHPRRPAQLTETVRQRWEAECEQRPGVMKWKNSPPDRKTVMRTVTRWCP